MPCVVGDAHAEDIDLRGDADVLAAGSRAVVGDHAGDKGAVAVLVGGVVLGGVEVDLADQAAPKPLVLKLPLSTTATVMPCPASRGPRSRYSPPGHRQEDIGKEEVLIGRCITADDHHQR